MNDTDYIRKAVELADGWSLEHSGIYFDAPGNDVSALTPIESPSQFMLDALAAQLVRQRYQDDPAATVIYEWDVMTTIRYLIDDS